MSELRGAFRASVALALILLITAGALLGTRWWISEGSVATPQVASDEAQVETRLQPAVTADQRQPASESMELSGPEDEGSTIVLEVLDAEQRAVPGATIYAARADQLLWQERTDDEGRVEAVADHGEASVVVWTAGRPLHVDQIPLEPGRRTIELSAGEQVAGVIQSLQGSPVFGLEVALFSDHPVGPIDSIPAIVWKALESAWRLAKAPYTARDRISTRTDAEGRFAFTCLPPPWSGQLSLGYTCRVDSVSEGEPTAEMAMIRLSRAIDDLRIVVELNPILRGRLLEAGTGRPLNDVELSAKIAFRGQKLPHYASGKSNELGRFEIVLRRYDGVPLRLEDLAHLRLSVGDPQEVDPFLELDGDEIPHDLDLGDLVLTSLRDIRFELRDSAGDAIAGGKATLGGIASAPTDASGLGILRNVPIETGTMRVVADGFVPRTVDLPETIPDRLELVLDAANRLELEFVEAHGRDLPSLLAELSCSTGITLEQCPHDVPGAPKPEDHCERPGFLQAGNTALSGFIKDRTVVFKALAPGRALTLKVRGMSRGLVFCERTLAALGPGEQRREVIELGQTWMAFRGQVVDPDGHPLVDANLRLGDDCRVRTDDEGEFDTSFPASTGVLCVSHPGFTTLVLKDFVVPPDGARVELCLVPEQRVEIAVVDTEGQPVPEAEVLIEFQEGVSRAAPDGTGKFIATGLAADASFFIRASVGGRDYRQAHDATHSQARVVVPLHGRVVVEFSPPIDDPGEGHVLCLLKDPSTQARSTRPIVSILDHESTNEVRFNHVFPGPYELTVLYLPSEAERASGKDDRQIIDPVPVEAHEGLETRVTVSVK